LALAAAFLLVARAGGHRNQDMPRMNLIGMLETRAGVTFVVVRDVLVGGSVLGGEHERLVVDVGQLDALGLAELVRVLFVIVGDLTFGRRNFRAEITERELDVAHCDLFVRKIVGVARFVVTHLHAAVDHIAERLGDHAVALVIFVFSRQ
jgi:hypothetical protein